MIHPSDPLTAALFLIVGLTLAGLAHSAWLRSGASQSFLVPLDGGVRLRGRRLFGENKTLRGFMVIVPAGAASFALLALVAGVAPMTAPWTLSTGGYAALGAWAAFGLMAGELPNSFIKRQLDVMPGAAPDGTGAAILCFVTDRLDSILGMLLAVSLAVPTPWQTWAWVIGLGFGVHLSFSVLLHRLGVKARPA